MNSGAKPFGTRTFRKEVFATVYHFNSSLKSKCVFRATSEKPSSDKLIDTLLIAG